MKVDRNLAVCELASCRSLVLSYGVLLNDPNRHGYPAMGASYAGRTSILDTQNLMIGSSAMLVGRVSLALAVALFTSPIVMLA